MAKIRHVAVFAKDVGALAEFYKTTFEMEEVSRGKSSIYLSDGYINLAILPARGEQPEGIDHFGFHVESVGGTARVAMNKGASQGPSDLPRDGRFAEAFIRDPVGQRVDLSVAGWRTEAGEPPEVRAGAGASAAEP